jgi:hypothetical protein
VTIGLLYEEKEYNVICNSNGTSIPVEVDFLKDFFNMFFMTHPVRDIFEEFESIFGFMNKFKSSIKSVHPALEKRFEVKRRTAGGCQVFF